MIRKVQFILVETQNIGTQVEYSVINLNPDPPFPQWILNAAQPTQSYPVALHTGPVGFALFTIYKTASRCISCCLKVPPGHQKAVRKDCKCESFQLHTELLREEDKVRHSRRYRPFQVCWLCCNDLYAL